MSTQTIPTHWTDDPEQLALLKRTLLAEATADEFDTFVGICRRTSLDPFARQIYATFQSVKRGNQWVKKMVVAASIDGFRIVAQRSGEYEGQTPALWCGEDGVWKDVWLSPNFPKACKVGVNRKGFREPLVAVATWESYVQHTKDQQGNQKVGHMWSKMPDLMLSKVAEALALRRAFPQDLSGLYTSDEMAQASNPAPSHKPEDEDQRPPDEKPPLAPTKPLPAGSFQTVPKAEDPAPVTKTPGKPVSAPNPATPDESGSQIIDLKHSRDWASCVYSSGKGAKAKHKKFGDLPPDFLDKLEAYYAKTPPKAKADQLYAEALRWRREELNSAEKTPHQQLTDLCAESDVTIKEIVYLANHELDDHGAEFDLLEVDTVNYILSNWTQSLELIKADRIPT